MMKGRRGQCTVGRIGGEREVLVECGVRAEGRGRIAVKETQLAEQLRAHDWLQEFDVRERPNGPARKFKLEIRWWRLF